MKNTFGEWRLKTHGKEDRTHETEQSVCQIKPTLDDLQSEFHIPVDDGEQVEILVIEEAGREEG
jgi:hypothetical protein